MIPLKLQIKNFLSYGSQIQDIDFAPYHLICLSGKNGHGKSALLDAITWVLWGNARKISGTIKADEGILKLGQTQMMVILDFECNGQKYRVKREFAKTYGKPYVTLEFGIYTDDNDIISLTEKKIRTTQKKIENTIHLTMETFVNSAFLRQGQANEFSKKSPKDRKEIFAQILGLQQYDIIKKLAMDKVKQIGIKKESISKFQEKIEIELQKKSEIEQKIVDITKDLSEITKKEKNIAEKQKNIEIKKKALAEDQKNYQIYSFQYEQLEKKEKEQQENLIVTRDEWRNTHKKQLLLPKKSILEKEKATVINIINKHQQTLQKRLKIKEEYLKHKEKIQNIEKEFYVNYNKKIQEKKIDLERLQITLSTEEKIFKELLQQQGNKKNEKKQLIEESNKIKQTVSLNKINKKELEKEESQFEKRKEYYQKYITQGNWIKKELDGLHQKQLLSQNEGSPSCPLCEQNLSASRKKFLKIKFETKKHFLHHRIKRLSNIIKKLKDLLINQHNTIEKLKKADAKNKLNEVYAKELEKKIQQIDQETENINLQINKTQKKQKQLCKDLEIENKIVKNLEEKGKKQLNQNVTYKVLLKKIDADEASFKNLRYDETAHKQACNKLQEIEKQITQIDKIGQQIALQQERKKIVHKLCISLKQIKKQKKDIADKLDQYKKLEKMNQEIIEQEKNIRNNIKDINKHKEILFQEKGGLENQKIKLIQLEKELKKQNKLIETLETEIDDYKTIASATGKNGIQALLIENAIPEVEQEANNILSKLTNNQSQIFIESLRDLKKGGTKETLDIKISDTAGIRSYELFSGGEAFRIDFALRIAISKLLARRAGTALQTLIIDEGFGSQDEEGLSRIMDAIYKIQDDFSKVIVVSHLSALKNQFPVHFFINKEINGSTINIVKQG